MTSTLDRATQLDPPAATRPRRLVPASVDSAATIAVRHAGQHHVPRSPL
jgi:hypothetical protein